MSEESDCLVVEGLHRSFQQGNEIINVLRGVDFSLSRGEIVGLAGHPGQASQLCFKLQDCSNALIAEMFT